METNLSKVAEDLYGKIQTRFSNIEIGNENAEEINNVHDVSSARFFTFDYTEGGRAIGTITITLDQDDGIVMLVSGDLVGQDNTVKPRSAYRFVRSIRRFAKSHLLKFDIQNTGKSNLDKRDYLFKAKTKTPAVMESSMYGSLKISYQDLGESRIVIRHKQPVNLESPFGRSQHVESIYIENAQGERFKYPRNHLNGARALAQHVNHGGNPYDSIGKHIIGLSEELSHLRKFKNFVNRQPMVAEAMSDVHVKVVERIENVRQELTRLQRPAYYSQFAEAFQESPVEEIPQSIIEDWTDRLTIRTFNEELSSAFPYLYRIIEESDMPVRELGPEDLLDADISTVVESPGEQNTLFSPNPQIQHTAVKTLERHMANPITNGPYGTTAIGVLKGIIDDPALVSELKNIDKNLDVRAIIQDYVSDQVRVGNLDFSAVGDLIRLDLDRELSSGEPSEPPTPTPPPAPEPEEQPVTPETEEEPTVKPAGVAEDLNSTKKFSSRPKFARSLSRRRAMSRALKQARKAGAMLETKLDFGYRVMTIQEAIEECGLDKDEIGYGDFEHEPSSGHQQVQDFIEGFYNEANENLVRGFTNFKQKLISAWHQGRDGPIPDASEDDIRAALEWAEKQDPPAELGDINRIRDLAGVKSRDHQINKPVRSVDEPQENDIGMIKNIMHKLNFGN